MDVKARELRKILDEVLPTDVDLRAFAIDAELEVAKRWPTGGDRVEMVNLLMQLHKPDEILAALKAHRKDRTTAALSRMSEGGRLDAGTPQIKVTTRQIPNLVLGAGKAERLLTISLTFDASRMLQVGYDVPVYGRLAEVKAVSLDAIERLAAQVRYDGRTGLAAVNHVLSRGDERDLARLLTGSAVTGEQGLGRLLYSILFPNPEAERAVLTHLFGGDDANSAPAAIRHGVTVRIWTSEPELLGLPWRLCCWKANLLADHGWTFAVTHEPAQSLPVRLSALSRVLVVAPMVQSLVPLNTQAHIDELRTQLSTGLPAQGKDEWFRVVHDREGLETALRAMPFDILYYYGHGSIESGQVQFVLGEGNHPKARLTPSDLLRLFGNMPPKLVLLNACFCGAAGWQSAGHLLSPVVPAVVCSLTTAYTHYAGALAIRFLMGVLLERRDPVELLHERDPSDPAQTQQDFQWATHAVFARYTSWEPTPINFQRHDPRNPLRLDRVHARAQVVEQVSALVDGSKRRVEALVAYGHEQTLVEKFSWQATDHLLRRRVAPVATVSLRFPQARTDLYQQLCEDFRRQVCAPGEPPHHSLRRHAPKSRTTGKPVLWLDWGVCGDGAQQEKLNLEQLRGWLSWSSEFLCKHCPEDLRIVSFVALQRPLDKYELLAEKMEDYKLELGSDRFRAWLLTPLPRVKKGDIKDYLSDPDLCSCADNAITIGKATELIYRDTEGHYEPVIAHIEWAEKNGWQSLIEVLKQKHEPTSQPDKSEDI